MVRGVGAVWMVVSSFRTMPTGGGLLQAIAATAAERVLLTHGNVDPLLRELRQRGLDAGTLRTEYSDEDGGDEASTDAAS